jgi:integrase
MPTKYELDLDRENGSGIWYVYWRGNVNGKVRSGRNSLKTRDKAEADAAFSAFLIRKGEKADTAVKSGVTYTIADLWAFYTVKLGKGRSLKRAEDVWKHCMRQHFGHLTVPEVTDSVVQDYVHKRVSGKLSCPGGGGRRRGVPVAQATVRNELVLLLACMNYCSQREHKKKLFDPTLIEAFDMPEVSKPRERALTHDEIDALLDTAAKRRVDGKLARIEIFLHLALGTAGREAAIRNLTFDPKRIDFERRQINLDDGHRLKKDKKRSAIYMNDTLFAVLKRALAESDQSVPLERRYVLGSNGTVWPMMQRVVYEAGLAPAGWSPPPRDTQPRATGISPHTLRHTAATHMVVAGIPLAHVAQFLGNSISMIEKVYKHLEPGHLKEAADVMNRGFRVVTKERGVA